MDDPISEYLDRLRRKVVEISRRVDVLDFDLRAEPAGDHAFTLEMVRAALSGAGFWMTCIEKELSSRTTGGEK